MKTMLGILIPMIVEFSTLIVHADMPGPPPPPPQAAPTYPWPQYQPPAPQYQPQVYQQPIYQAPPVYVEPTFNPELQYYCYDGCNPPPVPYPVVVLEPTPPPAFFESPYHRPWGWGPWRRGPGMRGPFMGRSPYHHHMSYSETVGCSVESRDDGAFEVMSVVGEVVYRDTSAHAAENAQAMKVYYEQSSLPLCGDKTAGDTKDI